MSSTWIIVLIIIGVLVFGKFILKSVGNLLKLALVVALVLAGIYFIKPELLHESFGEEKVENFVDSAKDTAKDAASKAAKAAKDITDDVADTTKVVK